MITSRCVVTDNRMGSRDLRCRNAIVAVFGIGLMITGCTRSEVSGQSVTTTASTPSSSPAITTTPVEQAVLAAYESFNDTTNQAELHPFAVKDKRSAAADFTQYAFDPERGITEAQIANLKLLGVAYRGTPPQSHPTLTTLNTTAKPYPAAVVTDCQTNSEKWRVYVLKTGMELPRTKPRVPPPYTSTTTMIFYQNHWGVQTIKVDSTKTCSA